MSQIRKDLFGVLKGIQMVASEGVRLQENYAKHIWSNSSVKSLLDETTNEFRNKTNSCSIDAVSVLLVY